MNSALNVNFKLSRLKEKMAVHIKYVPNVIMIKDSFLIKILTGHKVNHLVVIYVKEKWNWEWVNLLPMYSLVVLDSLLVNSQFLSLSLWLKYKSQILYAINAQVIYSLFNLMSQNIYWVIYNKGN